MTGSKQVEISGNATDDTRTADRNASLEDEFARRSQPYDLDTCTPKEDVWSPVPAVFGKRNSGSVSKEVVFAIGLNEVAPPTPPDGGWGWAIVVGSFMCMALIDGVCFSYGIFLSELQGSFGGSKMLMTLAGSLLTGCYFLSGPIVSGLLNRFNARALVIIGGLWSTVAIFASSFARNLLTFTILFGVCGGLGFGMAYLPAATAVTAWFVKKRATVTGIVTAGSGVGVTLYSMIIPQLIEAYTWRGCIMLLSAINLNMVVAGVLFRPLHQAEQAKPEAPTRPPRISISKLQSDFEPRTSAAQIYYGNPGITRFSRSSKAPVVSTRTSLQQMVRHRLDSTGPGSYTHSIPSSGVQLDMRQVDRKKSNQSLDDVTITIGNQLVPVPEDADMPPDQTEGVAMLSVDAVNHIVGEVLTRRLFSSATSLGLSDRLLRRRSTANVGPRLSQTETSTMYLKPDAVQSSAYFTSAVSITAPEDQDIMVDPSVRSAIVQELRKEIARPVHRKDLFHSGSIMRLDEYASNPDVGSYLRTITALAEEHHTRNPILAMLQDIFGVEIFKIPSFWILLVAGLLTTLGYVVPFQFLKDHAGTLNYSNKQSAYLLTFLGITNTIGRAGTGLLSDRRWVNVIWISCVTLMFAGVATSFVPLLRSYVGLTFYACFYGILTAAYIALRAVVIVEVLGLDRLTNAYGFLLLFQGFAYIASPPLLGYMYDVTRSYRITFVLGGAFIFLSGVVSTLLLCTSRKEHRKMAGSTVDDYEVNEDSRTRNPFHIFRKIKYLFREKLLSKI
ncbi:unnamed protein product [Calicophoron daubneyi]|uniref:Uncharacterized protein n=1 Tax=Calicophoron daubneyi TaxID=300641 RepID=A0AAV2TZB9_CALDB